MYIDTNHELLFMLKYVPRSRGHIFEIYFCKVILLLYYLLMDLVEWE